MKRLLQHIISLSLLALCLVFSLTLLRRQQGEKMLSVDSYSWAAHPNAIVILQRARSDCGCTPKINEMAMTGLSHGLDVLVMANAEAGEALALQKANLSKSISVVMPLAPAWNKSFFTQKQDLVIVRVRNGKIVKVVQNGVSPESFFR